jgi:DNA-directed RNA polymerase
MIHDSFGVHASKMQEFLDKCVKPAFIEMYRENVLQQFADRIPKEIPLEPLPEQGDLDPNGVMDSEFFFS